ncbi:MAG: hypothetical protein CMJ35_12255 [Phycisphaerae bacterium]|nr:hypothetical protein [Phycisphaerae bacterium]MBM92368.1 hypothetical protein [Phycisphaerae bacterium]
MMPCKTQTNHAVRRISRLSIAAALTLLSTHAGAQDALGNGQALDANPGAYGTANAARTSLADELRFRNSIATGNAPGGLSFRGDLGYRAAGEFTGELGSDSLFAFRRDSLYSGLAGMGIRGTDALQYQFALTTGSTPPRNLMGSLSYSRDDMYSSGSAFGGRGGTQSDQTLTINREQSDLDPRGQALSTYINLSASEGGSMMGTLRSSSTYDTTSSMQPSLMSVYTQGIDNKPVGLIASPLLGITPTSLVDPREEIPNPLVSRPDGPESTEADPTRPGAMPTTRVSTSYDELVQEMRERVQTMREEQGDASISIDPNETNDAWLVRQMEEIRNQLYGTPPQNTEQQEGQEGQDQTDPNAQPANEEGDDTEGENTQPPIVSIPELPDDPIANRIEESKEKLSLTNESFELVDPTEVAIDPKTREMLRGNAANEVEQLLDPGAQSRDLYSEHIIAGQRLISSGRYFDAEERFTHALSIKPRDVVAQQGRLHAQIGAGMLLSASVNLQALYSAHPELITTRYAEGVLPSNERVDILKVQLAERAGIIEPKIRTRAIEGDRVRVSAGMLLAYLSYQSKDQENIESGLQVVRELGSDSDRRFASLLAQLWLDPAPQP